MSSAAGKMRYTPEQYLAFERKSPLRHEYYDGSIVERPGASRWHNLIAGNLFGGIHARFRDRPCEVYVCAMRVRVRPTVYTYPDVVAVCGEPRFEDSEFDTLLNPDVIIEILSPSTEAHDRGNKFAQYRRLASLKEYVLVAQGRMLVERYSRQGEDWLLNELNRPEDVLRLDSIVCALAVREIYERVSFSEDGDT